MTIPEYVELQFMLPFYEMYFPDTWNDNNLKRNPFELLELCKCLNIKLDTDFLYNEYESTENKKGNIYIFYSNNNKNFFIYFDFLKDEYDQMAMVLLGVRVKTIDKKRIKDILKKLYFKSTTRSDFQEDYFNQSLYSVATNQIPNQNRIVNQYTNGSQIGK